MDSFLDNESDDESELSRQWSPEWDPKTSSIAEEDLIVFNPDKSILNIRMKPFRGPPVVENNTMVVFIDGSCQNNGRPNAKAAFGVYFGPQSKYNSAGRLSTDLPQTSTRAEIEALAQAVSIIDKICSNDFSITRVKIGTDSSFLVDSMTHWIDDWIENDGIGSNGQPVKHFETLRSLRDILHNMRYGDDGGIECDFWLIPREKNKDADYLARQALVDTKTAASATLIRSSIQSPAQDESDSGSAAAGDLLEELGTRQQRTSTKTKPAVFILNLDVGELHEGFFDDIYADLIASLASRYRVYRARKPRVAMGYLDDAQNRPIAILIVDPGVLKKTYGAVLERLKIYTQRGGVAVFMASFSSFISPPDMNNFWRNHWGLNWQCGDYYRTDFFMNKNVSLQSSNLPVSYSQKALCVKNVARSDCLYLEMPDSGTRSNDFVPDRAHPSQTPAALTEIDRGRLGYLGDVNNEVGSQKVVLEICRAAAAAAAA